MEERYRRQHQARLSWMPWLYFELRPGLREWAREWQQDVHRTLSSLETVWLDPDCFIAPEAHLFAEPSREISIGPESSVAAECFLHGPIRIGRGVSLNARVTIDGGAGGVTIGDHSRLATGVMIFAFEHGIAADQLIRDQRVTSKGIRIGTDVWVGAGASLTDGVEIGDHSVVGTGAVVTRDVAPYSIVAGVPARVIGDRRTGLPVTKVVP